MKQSRAGQLRYTIKDVYKNSSIKDNIPYEKYKKIWIKFSDILFEDLISTGRGYQLPHKFGAIQINKAKITPGKRLIDFKKTREYGFTVHHRNKHSDDYYGYIHWNTKHPFGVFKNKFIFKFSAARVKKRELAAAIKNDNTINLYYENE